MNPDQFLQQLRVASPCSAEWADMSGDDRTRFCGDCRKHVYNLSNLSPQAAYDLVQEKEGNLCIRLHLRRDGTVLADDCPLGARRIARRAKKVILAVAALGLFALGTALTPSLINAASPSRSVARTTLARSWSDFLEDLAVWLGLSRPTFTAVMGEIAVPPPVAPPSAPSAFRPVE